MISNLLIQEKTLDRAWQYWYDIITSNISEDTSRDGNVVGEIINAITVIQDPTRCIMKNPIRKLPMRYCIGELLWYLSGNNKLDAIRCIYDEYNGAECMHERSHYMVSNSSLIIALYNGLPGGTQKTIEFAKQQGLEVVIIEP